MSIARMARAARLALLFVCSTSCASAPRDERPSQVPIAPAPTASAASAPSEIEIRVLAISQRSRTAAQALERARTLSATARNGERMIELVQRYSEHPSAAVDFGVFRLRPKSPAPWSAAVAEAALALPVAGVSDPIATDDGYVVLERLPDPPAGPARIAAKHILISYTTAPQALAGTTHSEAEAHALAEDVAKQAHESNADWDALAAKYTEEPGGKERAGDLGQFGRGQMVPSFEAAAFALEVGAVSGVVSSPFGFHVIKRYE